MVKRTLFLFIAAVAAHGQTPQITSGGVVSAASYSSPIVPGEIIAIFGTNFVPGNTSVTVNGQTAAVVVSTATQVNAIVPAALPTQDPNLVGAAVVVTTPAGSSTAEIAALAGGAPGLFTANGSGCGQAAALNIRLDGTMSVNSAYNSAAPGDFVALFGTGIGSSVPFLSLDNTLQPSISYSGPAPGLAGVQQVNFQVPASTRNGCSVPVMASQTWASPTVTVAVQSGRGKCVDPPTQSFGTVILGSFFSAVFPAGPNLPMPVPEAVAFSPQWALSSSVGVTRAILSPAPIYFRSCAVPGYTNLSAGTIQIQPPSGAAVTVAPSTSANFGASYGSSLPTSFLVPGTYTISGSLGSPVPLNTTLTVGSPIQITSSFPAGTTISQSQPLTVNWTGGDSTSLVRVGLVSPGLAAYSYAYATAGSLMMSPTGLPATANGQITVEVLPATPKNLLLPGITGPVSVTWQYSYGFSVAIGN